MESSIVEELIALNSRVVKIVTVHVWYGQQEITCPFSLVNDDSYIGFRVGKKQIRILKNEVKTLVKTGTAYCISSILMKIIIMPV